MKTEVVPNPFKNFSPSPNQYETVERHLFQCLLLKCIWRKEPEHKELSMASAVSDDSVACKYASILGDLNHVDIRIEVRSLILGDFTNELVDPALTALSGRKQYVQMLFQFVSCCLHLISVSGEDRFGNLLIY
ncbi:hypothetical protein KCU90_g153, partial [Aureobasidium melanogenum]